MHVSVTDNHTSPNTKRRRLRPAACSNSLYCRHTLMVHGKSAQSGLTLAGLETRIGFVDDVQTPPAAHNTVGAVALGKRLQRVTNLHRIRSFTIKAALAKARQARPRSILSAEHSCVTFRCQLPLTAPFSTPASTCKSAHAAPHHTRTGPHLGSPRPGDFPHRVQHLARTAPAHLAGSVDLAHHPVPACWRISCNSGHCSLVDALRHRETSTLTSLLNPGFKAERQHVIRFTSRSCQPV